MFDVFCQDSAIEEALHCVDTFMNTSDVYTLALAAYAHSLHDVTSDKRAQMMAKLDDRAVVEGDFKYWTAGLSDDAESHYGANNAKSIDIEMTAYALLAYSVPGAEQPMNKGLPLVFWLSKQRSPGGGFSSTQVSKAKVFKSSPNCTSSCICDNVLFDSRTQ